MAENHWLKMIGAADKEVGDHWIAAYPKLLTEVRFPKQPGGIKRGDVLVYYAAGDQRIFAIVRAKGHGSDAQIVGAKGEGRWPYLLEVQTMLAIPQLALAPDWSALGIPSSSVRQQSHIRITHDQYLASQAAIVERTAGL